MARARKDLSSIPSTIPSAQLSNGIGNLFSWSIGAENLRAGEAPAFFHPPWSWFLRRFQRHGAA
jgi:hypothetical protein